VQITEATRPPADHRVDDQLEAVDDRDLATPVVRINPGSRSTPTSGYPVAVGTARTGTIPALPSGTYEIAAFSVEQTGNVSAPTTTTFTI